MKQKSILLVAVLALVTFFMSSHASSAKDDFAVGSTLDNFKLSDTNGKEQSLNDLKGKNGAILVFLSVQCPVVKGYDERIVKLAADYKAKGINVIGINSNATEALAETPNMIYYLYVVEEENSWKLAGLISLRSLILADPTYSLSEVMREQFQSAHPNDSAEEVAQTIAEYNLLALPVVDDLGEIAGIVTVDDAMEILLPKNLNNRLPRLFGK